MSIRKKSKAVHFLESISGGSLTMAVIIESERIGEKMTLAEFSRKLGISPSNLCDIEKGRRFVGPELAEQFAIRLGASKEQFVRIALQDQLSRKGLEYKVQVRAA